MEGVVRHFNLYCSLLHCAAVSCSVLQGGAVSCIPTSGGAVRNHLDYTYTCMHINVYTSCIHVYTAHLLWRCALRRFGQGQGGGDGQVRQQGAVCVCVRVHVQVSVSIRVYKAVVQHTSSLLERVPSLRARVVWK